MSFLLLKTDKTVRLPLSPDSAASIGCRLAVGQQVVLAAQPVQHGDV